MIRVIQQGGAWSVVRDGILIREGAAAAVHKTRELAELHAARLAIKLRDELDRVVDQYDRSDERRSFGFMGDAPARGA
jgi:hypothetical protein